MTDALDKLGDRGGTLAMAMAMEGSDGDALWRGEDKKGKTSDHAPQITRFLVAGACLQTANKFTNPTVRPFRLLFFSMGVKGLWTLVSPVGRPVLYV